MITGILGLCARDVGHETMYSSLAQALARFSATRGAWDELFCEAERQGIAPLLHHHLKTLDFVVPDRAARRQLQGLFLRTRRANEIRRAAIGVIVSAFQDESIDCLLVKGIALGSFVYRDPAHRPMRDIDLLVKNDDATRAEQLLFDLGYHTEREHDIPADYYHLPPLCKTIDGLPVTIEIHRNLLPLHRHYPRWPLERSYPSAMSIDIDGLEAQTLSLEDTLGAVFLHGFRAPLTYEPFRLVHVADIVSLVESRCGAIDWSVIRADFPGLQASISRFHTLTPWQDFVISELNLPVHDHYSSRPDAYHGWPRQRIRSAKAHGLLALLGQTLLPSRWWLQVYYGQLGGLRLLKTRLLDHPMQLLYWARVYWHAYNNKNK